MMNVTPTTTEPQWDWTPPTDTDMAAVSRLMEGGMSATDAIKAVTDAAMENWGGVSDRRKSEGSK